MQEQVILNGKAIRLDVLQMIDKKRGPINQHIVAVNATDLIFSPEVTVPLRHHITDTYPDLKTIYYRTWMDEVNGKHFSPVMEDDAAEQRPGINVSPEDLKKYELTLEKLSRS